MRQTHSTGIGWVQVLNCANGQAITHSANDKGNLSTDIVVLFLQEPWTDAGGRPPTSPLYKLFTPKPLLPKSAMYVRKDLSLNPRKQQAFGDSLKITITMNNQDIDLLNVYSTGRSFQIAKELSSFKPSPNSYIAGDFNMHNNW